MTELSTSGGDKITPLLLSPTEAAYLQKLLSTAPLSEAAAIRSRIERGGDTVIVQLGIDGGQIQGCTTNCPVECFAFEWDDSNQLVWLNNEARIIGVTHAFCSVNAPEAERMLTVALNAVGTQHCQSGPLYSPPDEFAIILHYIDAATHPTIRTIASLDSVNAAIIALSEREVESIHKIEVLKWNADGCVDYVQTYSAADIHIVRTADSSLKVERTAVPAVQGDATNNSLEASGCTKPRPFVPRM